MGGHAEAVHQGDLFVQVAQGVRAGGDFHLGLDRLGECLFVQLPELVIPGDPLVTAPPVGQAVFHVARQRRHQPCTLFTHLCGLLCGHADAMLDAVHPGVEAALDGLDAVGVGGYLGVQLVTGHHQQIQVLLGEPGVAELV